MKVAIIEDEKPAADKLMRYLQNYDNSIQVMARLPSIEDSVKWLSENESLIDLLFMDVQLTDGLSFEIMNQVSISCPIIFTTAFDEYAIDAFKVNSIDYLLKPITFTALSAALKKLESLKDKLGRVPDPTLLIKTFDNKQYKDRFLVKMGNHIHSIKTGEIALFYAEGRTVFLMVDSGKRFIIDYKLEELEELLDPKVYFRVNRSFILNINAINDILVYSGSRLKISLHQKMDKEIIVSRDKVSSFKQWLEG